MKMNENGLEGALGHVNERFQILIQTPARTQYILSNHTLKHLYPLLDPQ